MQRSRVGQVELRLFGKVGQQYTKTGTKISIA